MKENKIYKAAIYVRLSKEDGDVSDVSKAESNSISNQKELIREFLKNKEDIAVVSERIDDGYSGVNFERPAFQLMLEDIKQGKVDCVVVKDDCVIKARTPQTLENRHFLRIGTEFRAIQRPQRAAYHIETS